MQDFLHPQYVGWCIVHYLEVSWVIGLPPVIIHWFSWIPEINHPAIGIPPFLETPASNQRTETRQLSTSAPSFPPSFPPSPQTPSPRAAWPAPEQPLARPSAQPWRPVGEARSLPRMIDDMNSMDIQKMDQWIISSILLHHSIQSNWSSLMSLMMSKIAEQPRAYRDDSPKNIHHPTSGGLGVLRLREDSLPSWTGNSSEHCRVC